MLIMETLFFMSLKSRIAITGGKIMKEKMKKMAVVIIAATTIVTGLIPVSSTRTLFVKAISTQEISVQDEPEEREGESNESQNIHETDSANESFDMEDIDSADKEMFTELPNTEEHETLDDSGINEWFEEGIEYNSITYDLNSDGRITIADLTLAKKYAYISDKLSENDVENIKSYILEGEWLYNVNSRLIDIDNLDYTPENASELRSASAGLITGMYYNDDEGFVVNFLNDAKLTQIESFVGSAEISQLEFAGCPIAYAFNYGDKHVALFETYKGLVWKSYDEFVVTTEARKYWAPSNSGVNFTRYYDFDKDSVISVFDLVYARKYLKEGKLCDTDLFMLKEYLLTGIWNQNIVTYEYSLNDYSYNTYTINTIADLSGGVFVDSKQEGTCLYLRFLKDVNIYELSLDNYAGDIVLPIKYHVNDYGYGYVIGATENGTLSWEEVYPGNQISDIF